MSENENCSACEAGDDESRLSRRHFLYGTAGAVLLSHIPAAFAAPNTVAASGIPYRRFANKVDVSAICLGGYHIGLQRDEQESIKIIRTAIDSGINFMDNCSSYNGGESELRMGKALRDDYRSRVFLMTKIDSRDCQSAAAEINQSLRRLQTDSLDLLLLHDIKMHDPDRIFAEQGAIHAVLDARKDGKVRFIGFSGHKNPAIHMKMLDVATAHGIKVDAVLMPINLMDAHFQSFETAVLPRLHKENITVLGMKPMCGGKLLSTKLVTPIECLHYSLSQRVASVLTGCDSLEILHQAINAAKSFKPLSETEVAALRAKTALAAADGKIEFYKTLWN